MTRARRDLDAAVHAALRSAGLSPRDRLVVGLSGGVDSQTLTHSLAQLRARGDGPDLRLVYVDHRLRSASSDDARRVARIAEAFDLPLDVVQVNVDEWDAALGQGLEAAARAARYAALAGAAQDWRTNWVAVGHNLDDQVETILLRLARGAGLDGLAGMRAVSSRVVSLDPAGTRQTTVNLLRPLLSLRRAAIEAYAAEHGLVPVVDESNVDPRFRRNALRHELIPVLERIVPGASASIARTSDLIADDVDFLNDLAAAAFERCCRRSGALVWLDRQAFREQPLALQRRTVLLAVRAVSNELALTRERVEALRTAALEGTVASRIEIGGGMTALVDYDAVLIGPEVQLEPELRRRSGLPELEPGTVIALERSMSVSAGSCWTIEIEHPSQTPGWVLRTRRPGDRILRPDGHHARLQDWLVDRKMPVALRDSLPLLVRDGEVRWVAGVSENDYEDVHSRLSARLVKRTGDAQRDGEHAPDN
ncbi:MAG TPA: tRNA lysidine(34) synthetase TilS [Nitrolancea sp.]|nr:tRNA lysidine(34) synthetase TilS [Nitrolancea sp.]